MRKRNRTGLFLVDNSGYIGIQKFKLQPNSFQVDQSQTEPATKHPQISKMIRALSLIGRSHVSTGFVGIEFTKPTREDIGRERYSEMLAKGEISFKDHEVVFRAAEKIRKGRHFKPSRSRQMRRAVQPLSEVTYIQQDGTLSQYVPSAKGEGELVDIIHERKLSAAGSGTDPTMWPSTHGLLPEDAHNARELAKHADGIGHVAVMRSESNGMGTPNQFYVDTTREFGERYYRNGQPLFEVFNSAVDPNKPMRDPHTRAGSQWQQHDASEAAYNDYDSVRQKPMIRYYLNPDEIGLLITDPIVPEQRAA